MAGLRFSFSSGVISPGSGTTKTLLQLTAPANQKVRVEKLRLSGKNVTASDAPTQVELLWQTDAGTGGLSTLTPVKLYEDDTETIQSSILYGLWATTEPSAGGILLSQLVDPKGHYDFLFPPMRELVIAGGSRLGIRVVSTPVATSWIISGEFEE